MTKSDLVSLVAEKSHLQYKQSELVVNAIFDTMVETLVRGDRIEIRGFGTFINRVYQGYRGRNPKTGELVEVTAKKIPFFKVGKELKERVDTLLPKEASLSK